MTADADPNQIVQSYPFRDRDLPQGVKGAARPTAPAGPFGRSELVVAYLEGGRHRRTDNN